MQGEGQKGPSSQIGSQVLLVFFIPEAYHLRREETDWFDKPRDGRSENGQEKRQVKQEKKKIILQRIYT